MYYKYPRTFHLPWSPGATSDDKILKDTKHFEDQYVVVSEKRDGECTTIYPDKVHARSIDSKDHPSRHRLKQLQAEIGHLIPQGFRICGENLFAKHSIYYTDLTSYFEVFSIWEDDEDGNVCLSYDETIEWCNLLGLTHVPVIMQGPWEEIMPKLLNLPLNFSKQEGYVVRNSFRFMYESFHKNVAKYVRSSHVQTSDHWMNQQLVPNRLKK